MKPSSILLCLAPAIAVAQAERVRGVTYSPSVPNTSPSVPVADIQTIPEGDAQIPSEAEQLLHQQVTYTQVKPDTIPIPLSRSARSRRTRRTTAELTKRSEGTLGQTPWIGMAIGLTCTTLAAVMLG